MKKNLLVNIAKIVFVVAGILMVLALVMPSHQSPNSYSSTVYQYNTIILAVTIMPIVYYIAVALGIIFGVSNNEKCFKVGSGLLLAAGITNLVAFVQVMDTIKDTDYTVGFGSIAGLISFILVVAGFILIVVNNIMMSSSNTEDANINKIMQWKKLENEEIITHEEFIAKRDELMKSKK